jgi:hypothetical protein
VLLPEPGSFAASGLSEFGLLSELAGTGSGADESEVLALFTSAKAPACAAFELSDGKPTRSLDSTPSTTGGNADGEAVLVDGNCASVFSVALLGADVVEMTSGFSGTTRNCVAARGKAFSELDPGNLAVLVTVALGATPGFFARFEG